jgi:hypothetical protein
MMHNIFTYLNISSEIIENPLYNFSKNLIFTLLDRSNSEEI